MTTVSNDVATTRLDGGGQTIDLGDGHRLTAAGTAGAVTDVTARERSQRGVRREGAAPGKSPLDEALRASGVTEVRSFEVTAESEEPRKRGKRGAAEERALSLEVPAPPEGHEQVVAGVDQDGAVSWHLPEGNAERVRRRAKAGQRFTVGARFPTTEGASVARAKRGITGTVGKMVLKVLVYPVTDPVLGPISEHFARKWEEKNRPYGVRHFTPEHFREANAEPMTENDWREMGNGRSLLFIHGTFSTAHGAFGGLPDNVMRALHERYQGRVWAVNLFTLSDDPAQNAQWIVSQIPKGVHLQADVVCHSRGGLVARELVALTEEATLGDTWLRVKHLVFVAVPNHGTPLANPDHMMAMIDRLTSALNIAPTGPVTETLETIVTAVKVIGHGAMKSLAGIAAMNPSGETLARLNRAGRAEAQYFAIAADYSPPTGGGLFRLVAETAGDRVVDKVFGDAPNDLVVPTTGVTEENGSAGFPIEGHRVFRFPATRSVMHTHYFEAEETGRRLLEWLSRDQLAISQPREQGGFSEIDYSAPRGGEEREGRARAIVEEGGGAATRGRRTRRGTRAIPPAFSAPPAEIVQPPPAGGAPEPGEEPVVDEGTEVHRSPSISSPDQAVPGKKFEVVVDLLYKRRDEETRSTGVVVEGLPPMWTEEKIDVRVDSPVLDFDPGEDKGTVTIRRNTLSSPATLHATVRADATSEDGNFDVVATFYYKGRLVGNAVRAFLLTARGTRAAAGAEMGIDRARAGGAAAATPDDAKGATTGAAAIDLTGKAPRLTVVIFPPDKEGKLYWRLEIETDDDIPGLPERRTEQCAIGTDSAAFAAGLYAQADRVEPGQHRSLFNGIGERLFETTPKCFRQTYWALREKYGKGFPIQFVSGEPYIPWELMRPVDRDANKAGDLLAIDHPVARWLLDFEGTMRARLPKGDVVTVAPDYSKRQGIRELPAAQEEAVMLAAKFGAKRLAPATHASVLALLRAKSAASPVAVLHFAGHGEFDTGAANGSRVLLADGDLRVSDVRSIDTQLGRHYGTFVVFNACEVGQETKVLDTIGGWAEAFLHERFGGFLAPLWPAYDEDARTVMQEFFTGAVRARRPLGEVIREIREKHADESPTFLSYMYFGDVMGTFA
jgi:CHAT domain-containing protein